VHILALDFHFPTSVLPARRAARPKVIDALSYE
jgi:hypothetical protein